MSINIKNPVEREMADIEQRWLTASANRDARLFVWRIPQESDRLLYGFFALQQQADNEYRTQDLFISFQAAYQTAYQYSHALEQEFIECYEATDIEDDKWFPSGLTPCYRAKELNALFADFITHHGQTFTDLVVVLMPGQISHMGAFSDWLRSGLAAPIAERVRFILVDTLEEPLWQALVVEYPQQVALIEMELDETALMRQVLNESPSTDETDMLRFRQQLLDTFMGLKTGHPEQLAVRAQPAIEIALKNHWYDQLVVMHSMLAGGYLQTKDIPNAVSRYQLAQQNAMQIPDLTQQRLLQTQSVLGEAGAWFVGQEYLTASTTYADAAQLAEQLPQPLWVIEGYRLAGMSLLETKEQPWLAKAAEYYYQAWQAGIALPVAERPQSTLMYVFQDLMRFLDNERVDKLSQLASKYQTRQAEIIVAIEQAQQALNQAPTTEQVIQYDATLDQQMVSLFDEIIQTRETLIFQAKGDFSELIRFARRCLHPYWSVEPAIAHPLDEPPEQWLTPYHYTPAIDAQSDEGSPEAFYALLQRILTPDGQAPYGQEGAV